MKKQLVRLPGDLRGDKDGERVAMTEHLSANIEGVGRIYKRGKVWYLDLRHDGMRYRRRCGTKAEAIKGLSTNHTDINRGELRFVKKQVVHFSDFAKEYLKIKAGARSIRSIRGYVKHLKDFFGELPLSRITPELVVQYQEKRFEDKIGGKKKATRTMAGSSVNRELATLKCLFNTARTLKRFHGDNPVSGVEFYPEQGRDRILSDEELGNLLAVAGEPLRKIILIALNTGFRKGEILSLRWSQVEEGGFKLARTKSAKFLRVPVSPIAEEVLATIERRGEYLFPGRWGKGHLVDCKKEFDAARKKAKLSDFHFHDLRHSAATYMAAKGVPLTMIQAILGHQDPRTTGRYINYQVDDLRKAVGVLSARFSGLQSPEPAENRGTNGAQAQNREGATVAVSRN